MQRITLLKFNICMSDVPKPIYICLEQVIHIMHYNTGIIDNYLYSDNVPVVSLKG